MRRTRIFISHSSKDDTFASLIRDAVADDLEAQGFTVLLDRRRLDPGDRWRAKLHRWLGMCDGAVFLFNAAALESDWVRNEATIVTWRREFEPGIRLLPAVLGGVERRALNDFGLGPLQLRENEIASLTPAEQDAGTEAHRARLLASRIVAGFSDVKPLTAPTAMSAWIRQVAAMIRNNEFLEDAAAVLFEPDDFEAGDDPVKAQKAAELAVTAERVAYQILHSDAPSIERAFDQLLAGGLPKEKRIDLARLVIPSWVPAESAKAIAAAARISAGPRVVALRAGRPNTPEHVVRKATCCDVRHELIAAKSMKATTEDPRAELARLYRDDVQVTLGVDRGSKSPAADIARGQMTFEDNGKRMFVILGSDAVESGVGPVLWHEQKLDRPVYVLVGDGIDAASVGLPHIAEVKPELAADAELDGAIVGARMLGKAGRG